jgi:hypothetical protein
LRTEKSEFCYNKWFSIEKATYQDAIFATGYRLFIRAQNTGLDKLLRQVQVLGIAEVGGSIIVYSFPKIHETNPKELILKKINTILSIPPNVGAGSFVCFFVLITNVI